ncbi:cytochrome P450 84A1-like [Lolium rigidum]|uniref:cytochrome P450 84A1-like n=1 Tax=Lolium rigidum TaxID=89674 RepID=UPI001F5D4BEB|nr:cytochrome P450 84A1-like [Lolium rigidum]
MAAFAKLAMECLQDPVIWLFFASLAFLLLQKRSHDSPPLPPGPKPLPIIGNMLMGDQFTHRGLATLAKNYGELLHLRVGSLRIFVVSTPELARQVLHTQDADFAHRPATAAVRFLTYGRSDLAFAHSGSAYWRQMRKLCATKLFSRRRPETWLAVRDGYGALARAVGESSGQAVNLGDLIFRHTVRVIFHAAFSTVYDDERLDEFISMFPEFSKLLEAFHIGDFFPWLSWMGRRGFERRLHTARDALGEFLDKIIDDHVTRGKNPEDADADMVDGLLGFIAQENQAGGGKDGEDGPRFTRDNVKAVMMDMLFGGPDTIGATIEWAMAEMIRSPDILLRLQQELADVVGLGQAVDESDLDKLPFLKCVVKETFRTHPPIPMHLHGTTKDCILGGYSVPSGSRVLINAWAIGRDGKAWKDADKFRPSRFMPGEGEATRLDLKGGCYEFLPFGAGRRSCPAQGLGPYTVEFAVATLAHGFEWELPDGMNPAELDMADLFGVTVSRAKRLCAVPKPRLTCSL